MVQEEDRPQLCDAIECAEYTPCISCGKNKKLRGGRCNACVNKQLKQVELESLAESDIEDQYDFDTGENDSQDQGDEDLVPARSKAVHAKPGEPHPEFEEYEKEFYEKRWAEYSGYYRNPSALFIVHCIILEELYITELIQRSLTAPEAARITLVKARDQAYKMLDTLRKQLPEKESEELSDYEKSLSVIYEGYCKEKRLRYFNGVSRLLSDDAIALAPMLAHKVDLNDLLSRLGYKQEEVSGLLERYEKIDIDNRKKYTEKDIERIMEFFGYRLREKYAMKYETLEEQEVSLDEMQELTEELVND